MVEGQRLAGAVPIWNTLVPKEKPPTIWVSTLPWGTAS